MAEDEHVIDVGYMSLPPEVQRAVEAGAPKRACEHRHPNEDQCGTEAPYVVSVGQRRHDAQASCERHLGDSVAALAYAEEPPPDVTVRAAAPLLRALTEAADERDRFREQARILGEQKAEWLCEACSVIHPWRDGDRFTADCPECGWPMTPTSISVRALQEAREHAEAAEAKLAAIADRCAAEHGTWIRIPSILAIIGSKEEGRDD